jgi:hypothetical protein
MGLKLNPLTGNFDLTGSGGGGGASYIDGEVANFAALPVTVGDPAVGAAYLVREAQGVWPVSYKPGGIYVRTANAGAAADWTYAGVFPDVFADSAFLIYDDGNTSRQLQIELTDNETITFKLTGTDATVRSVSFALS